MPRRARVAGSIVNSPVPSLSQRIASSAAGARPAGHDGDPVGDDEARVEADAELADQLRVLLLVAGEAREELARAAARDRAEVLDRLGARHADAVVRHGDGARGLVERDVDRELGVAVEELGMRDRLEAQLVAGVGRVAHELAQEDLLVRVERVDHQLQQLLDLGLEAQRLAGPGRGLGGAHRSVLHRGGSAPTSRVGAGRVGTRGAFSRGAGRPVAGAPGARNLPRSSTRESRMGTTAEGARVLVTAGRRRHRPRDRAGLHGRGGGRLRLRHRCRRAGAGCRRRRPA